jgi:hypothetical protein
VTDHVVDDIKILSTIASAAAGFAAAAPAVDTNTTLYPKAHFTIQVSDNRMLQPMSLPSTGSVTMHSVCGADRTDSSSGDISSKLSALSQIFSAAQSAYNAWNKTPTTQTATVKKSP